MIEKNSKETHYNLFTDDKSPNDSFKENYKEGRIQKGSCYKQGNVSIGNGIVTRTFNTPVTGPLAVSVDSNIGVEATLETSLDLKIVEPGAKVLMNNNGFVGTKANVRIGSSELYKLRIPSSA
ncbi:hypothetical protein [Pseudoalteromonas spongiae]|uniref:hypothetical protein n=1 Tax=Pseudoalteromonas spongiae TaxID=298657 RepID=UPI000C2D0B99|nr:hypothetical protein [Pseudoalteromonas spongiae]